jgi:hypothetical protein
LPAVLVRQQTILQRNQKKLQKKSSNFKSSAAHARSIQLTKNQNAKNKIPVNCRFLFAWKIDKEIGQE